MYLNLKTNEYPVSRESIQKANPNAFLPAVLSKDDLTYLGLVEVVPAEQPLIDNKTHKVIEGKPIPMLGVWVQSWKTVELTPEEMALRERMDRVTTVEMAQARKALILSGFDLAKVEPVFLTLPQPAQDLARVDWEFAANVHRDNPLVHAVQQMQGWSDSQVDDMFKLAATLQ